MNGNLEKTTDSVTEISMGTEPILVIGENITHFFKSLASQTVDTEPNPIFAMA